MMPSVKQVEAFYWSGTLGSFVAAADRLNTTQSNISKRIQEMEMTLGISVFDRTRRAIRLTPKGEELMRASENFLRAHSGVTAVGGNANSATGPFRFGVTEAVALTWLPRLCGAISGAFPSLVPTSRVDTSTQLNLLLRERKIDLAIGTKLRVDSDFEVTELASLDRVWLASPSLVPHDRVLSAAELARLPFLGHGDMAAAEVIISRYLRDYGVSATIVTSCTNLTALARMAAAGMGITYLHRGVFDDEIRLGRLREVQTEIVLPKLQYVAVHRDDPLSPLTKTIAEIAKSTCDFSWNWETETT
ncbi:MAG: hypothetical protein ABS75_25985 [Pelagibacterium sp. SCN 63-23]|nr:MAG: hypothetical protein ABS75_25985 [Pelagibacterium sp. SCN 63-23]